MSFFEYELLAEAFTIFALLLLYFIRRSPKKNLYFIFLLICTLVYSVLDSIQVFILDDNVYASPFVTISLNKSLIILEVIIASSLTRYVVTTFAKENSKWVSLKHIIRLAFVMLDVILILFFYKGQSVNGTFIVTVNPFLIFHIALLLSLYLYTIYIFIRGKYIKNKTILTVYLMIFLSLFISVLAYNYMLNIIFSILLLIYLIFNYFVIENQSKYLNTEFNTYNMVALDKSLPTDKIKTDLHFILIKIKTAEYFDEMERYENTKKEQLEVIIKKSKKVYKFSNVFYLGSGLICVVSKEFDRDSFLQGSRDIYERYIKQNLTATEIVPEFSELFYKRGTLINKKPFFNMIDIFKIYNKGYKKFEFIEQDNTIYLSYNRNEQIIIAIKNAIEYKTLKVFFQPIYDLKHKKTSGAEALVRLIDDKIGFIPPDEFIPIAERNGLISKIDLFVIEEVCKFIHKESSRLHLEYIDVNLSRGEAASKIFLSEVLFLTEKYEIEASKLHLEITETSDKGNDNLIIDNMLALKELGFSFSLDDYGSGYASLDYIAKYNFDVIKIDKSLIWDRTQSKEVFDVLKNIIAFAKKLNKKVIVEGVETKEHVSILNILGVEYLQGYYFSRPLPKKDYIAFLEQEVN